jgi:malonate transporter and related proteins
MAKVLADALVPIFADLLLGYFAGLWHVLDRRNVHTLITFVMSLAVPSSLFLAIASTPLAELGEQAGAALVLTIVYVVLYAVTFFWSHWGKHPRPSSSSVVALTLSFPNSAAVGPPLLAAVFGPKSLVTVATSIAVGSITISPITLAILEADQDGSGKRFSLRQIGLQLLRSLKNRVGSVARHCILLYGFEPAFLHESICRCDGFRSHRVCSRAYRFSCFGPEIRVLWLLRSRLRQGL